MKLLVENISHGDEIRVTHFEDPNHVSSVLSSVFQFERRSRDNLRSAKQFREYRYSRFREYQPDICFSFRFDFQRLFALTAIISSVDCFDEIIAHRCG